MTKKEAKQIFLNRGFVEVDGGNIFDGDKWRESCRVISEWLEQEPKIKVLDNDEVARKLGTVDIYMVRAWTTLLNDLEYLGLKICEVEE